MLNFSYSAICLIIKLSQILHVMIITISRFPPKCNYLHSDGRINLTSFMAPQKSKTLKVLEMICFAFCS